MSHDTHLLAFVFAIGLALGGFFVDFMRWRRERRRECGR